MEVFDELGVARTHGNGFVNLSNFQPSPSLRLRRTRGNENSRIADWLRQARHIEPANEKSSLVI